MRKIKVLTFYILFALIIFTSADYNINNNLSAVFSDIIELYNNGNKTIYNYVDLSNSTLYKKIKGNIGKGNISYSGQVNVKTLDNNEYLVGVQMTGNGKVYNSGWAFSDMFMTFRFKYDENRNTYILTDTDFFDKSGIDLLRKAYSELLINVLVISFFIFIVILLISYRVYKKAMNEEIKSNNIKYMDNNVINL